MIYLYWLQGRYYSLLGRIGMLVGSIKLIEYGMNGLLMQNEKLNG